MTGEAPRIRRPVAGPLARGTALCLVMLITGCSYVPDWANPVDWYDSVAGGDAPPPQQADTAIARPVPGADQSFPTLASVPDRPEAPTGAAERQRVAQGLVADRDNAKYTEQVANTALQQQAANTAPLPPPPAPPPGAPDNAAANDNARPPTLGAAPPAPPPAPPAQAVVQGDESGPGRIAAPPPPSPDRAAPLPRAAAPAASAPPPPAADRYTLPDGRPRMAVPEIVQRSPSTDERLSGGAGRMPPTPPRIGDSTPQPSATTRPVSAPPASTPPAPGALPSEVRAAAPPPPTPTPAPPPAAPVASAPPTISARPPAPSATAQRLNLPVGQDQQALEEAFARNVAAQDMTMAALPGSDPVQGGGVADSAGTVYVGGAPGGTAYARQAAGGAPQAGLVATISFGHGSSRLGAGDLRKVREAAAAARASGGIVRVVGHSSQRTANMPFERHLIANFNMSLDRANAVARALAEAGVPAERIVVEAVGDQQPLYFEFMPNGEAENRRAEIFLE